MIKVTVGSNMNRRTVEVDESTTTLRSVLDNAGIDYTRFTVHLDGDTVTSDKLDKTFAENGVMDNCFLVSVSKTDSAM
mgnify:FL=1